MSRTLTCVFLLTGNLAATSCSADSVETCAIPIDFGNDDIERRIAAELDQNTIPYNWIDGVLCPSLDYMQPVESIVKSTVQDFLDPPNSIWLKPEIQDAVKISLKENKVDFREVPFRGKTYLVWNPGDAELVKRLIDSQTEKYFHMRGIEITR